MKSTNTILKMSILLVLVLCLLASAVSCSSISPLIKNSGYAIGGRGRDDVAGVDAGTGYAMAERGGEKGFSEDAMIEGRADEAIEGGEEVAPAKVAKEGSADETVEPVDPVETAEKEEKVRPRQITVGAQDDNSYYNSWLKLFSAGDEQTEAGKFHQYLNNSWGMNTQRRLTVTVRMGETPVANALVCAKDADGNLLSGAVTNASGVAYLFPGIGDGTVTVESQGAVHSVPYDAESRELTVSLDAAAEKGNVIDLMFVVDVTGSMGDEIRYLQAELEDVINRVAKANANATVNLALLFYRDHEDSVPFRYVDFRNVTDQSNLKAQLNELAKENADGGGDYEEAVDEALQLAMSKNWSENSTKMLFLVLDAPAHNGQVYESRFSKAVKDAAKKGIRICPILASGADEVCEYTTRSAAIMTGGTFLFITNHSGIGGDHYDPDLPNVTIEYLNDCLVRLINGYHTGTFADPVAWDANS